MDLDWQSAAVFLGTVVGTAVATYQIIRLKARRAEERRLLPPDDQPRVPTRKEWHELTDRVQEHAWTLARMKEERGALVAQVASLQRDLTARLEQMAKEERERYECLSEDINGLKIGLAKLGGAA